MPQPFRPRWALVAAAALAIVVLVAPGASASAAKRVSPAPTPAPTLARGWGVTMPGVPWDTSALTALTQQIGDTPSTVMWYDAWSNGTTFPVDQARAVAATGSTVTVTWEPWDPAAGVDQPSYADARVARGAFDTYLRAYARSVKAYGGPVTIRWGHEANGTWYPWAAGVNGNTAASYVAAFRHVHDVFAAQGVTNVSWAWTPNVPYPGSTSMASLYPGDAYVDQVGLDGYNWGTTQSWSTWTSFWDLFGPGVGELQAITARPIWLGEVGSAPDGGDKAAWVSDMFAQLAAHPEVRGFTWFDLAKEADWRIDSSPESLGAFAAGAPTL